MLQRAFYEISQRYVKYLEGENLSLKNENASLKDDASMFEAHIDDTELTSMKDVARLMKCGIGRNKMFAMLRDQKVLDDDNNPYQLYINQRYFVIKETVSGNRIVRTTYVTRRGMQFIRRQVQSLTDEQVRIYRTRLANKQYMMQAVEDVADKILKGGLK